MNNTSVYINKAALPVDFTVNENLVKTGDLGNLQMCLVAGVISALISVVILVCILIRSKKRGMFAALSVLFFMMLLVTPTSADAATGEIVDYVITEKITLSRTSTGAELDVTPIEIENVGTSDIYVERMCATAENGWMFGDISTDWTKEKIGNKKLNMTVDGIALSDGYEPKVLIGGGETKSFEIKGKTGAFAGAVSDEKVATIITTICGNHVCKYVDDGKHYCDTCQVESEHTYIKGKCVCGIWESPVAYAVYSESDKSLEFFKGKFIPKVGESSPQGKVVTAIYEDIEKSENAKLANLWISFSGNIQTVTAIDGFKPENINYWFSEMKKVTKIDLRNMDVSNITNFAGLFSEAGYNADSISIDVRGWNTSKATSMSGTFTEVGYNVTGKLEILGLEDWKTSNVYDMGQMFEFAGPDASIFDIGEIGGWDVSNVQYMDSMFRHAANSINKFNIKGILQWETDSLRDITQMFMWSFNQVENENLDFTNWDVSNVTKMKSAFNGFCGNAKTLSLDFTNWNTSKVTTMESTFRQVGDITNEPSRITSLSIKGLNTWNTSKVTSMRSMFYYLADDALSWNVGDLSGWNTSNVTDMRNMFCGSGRSSTNWNIGNISKWDTSKVTDMTQMFCEAGYKTNYKLDLRQWKVPLVIYHNYFNGDVETKVLAPSWVN